VIVYLALYFNLVLCVGLKDIEIDTTLLLNIKV